MLWAWPVVERLQQESLNPKLMDTQLAASASLLAPPSAFQNNSSSSNNNKKMLRGEAEKELVGFYINFIHMLCSVLRGLDPSWERFPASVAFLSAVGEFSATIFCGCWWRRRRPCRGWRCVCAAEIGSRETGLGEVECFTAPASLYQSAAKVWPLCGFGGHVPVGASSWQEKWAVNKAGSRQVPLAQHMPDPCAARRLLQLMTGGASAWERPLGPQQVPVGAVPAVLLLFHHGGSSPTPSESPGGGCPSLGRCRGRLENGAPLWGAGLPLPPSLTAKIQAGCPARGSSDGAVEGCRGRRVGIKTSVRRPGRRSL